MHKARSLRSLAISTNINRQHDGPPSPTFSEVTNASAMNFGENGPAKIVTRADLKASMQAYDNLLNSCANYRSALLNMSRVTAMFADAMEVCASMKGPTYEQGTRLQAASGLHHMIGNHWHVLSETLDKSFEKPLRQHLETYRTIVHERSASYERALREKSNIIRDTEKRNMNRKERNLQSFRQALIVLQRQVDELDELKARHYEEILEHEEEVWDVVQGKARNPKICVVVRSTMDVFDRFTAKASDPVIEPMLQSVPDPFDSYGQQPSEDQIFSILPPLSIMAAASPSPSPLSSTPQTEASDIFATGTTAWGPPPAALYTDTSTEWADATSPSPSTSTSPTASASPRSSSPSHRVHRPASPPNSRRTESKLRSVLAVIDEARNRTLAIAPATNGGTNGSGSRNGNGNGNGIGTNSGASTSTGTPSSSLSSSGLNAPPAPDAARDARISSWAAFPFASYASRPGSEETTPRSSTFFAPTVPPDPDPAPDVERERGRGRSPQSDETATITAVPAVSAAAASAS
ncbi:hypothetical protein HETIRDRAFT_313056 [Heterobasidion irregulare TC 32-1]|uniref:IMD domain-containing protein n=1 Tax=Heterobasidion irregulare (strain TC 32-1) TaxID=747525 RepID=W4KGC5_HETIT|nr:uncharacterized protein HETIRDRAFT_313056 [Heterobasidion irregulare TC 32-1]ETW84350.1 hypothetical protein HETIRDRAFT_313056 [Heterobasidion irregulare TC 32-1]